MLFASCDKKQEQPSPDPEPEPTPVSEGAYKRVIILGVDGAGAFFNSATTPNAMAIFKNGAQSFNVLTSYPSISAQCWGSMLHGVLPEFHRLTNDITGIRHYDPESPFPSIFRIAREAFPDAELASFCNWNNINYGIIEEGFDIQKGQNGDDEKVTEMAIDYLNSHDPTLLFVTWDSVDAAGHHYGYGSEGHAKALSNVDRMIGQIYDALKKKGLLEDTLLMLSADHGGTPEGSHGGDSAAETNVYLGVLGKTVETSGVIREAEVQDIPAIAAYALGIKIPENWTGRVPSGLFYGVTAKDRKVIEVPVSETRKHKTVKTPDISLLKTLLKDHKVTAYLPFDSNIDEMMNNVGTTLSGKNYFYDGYFGKGISLVDGYVTLEDVKFGTGSFSVALWIKANEVTGDPSIISNKDWRSGMNDGFVISLRPDDIKFNVGSQEKQERIDVTVPLPLDFDKGWMHLALTVDRKNAVVCFYIDFKLECKYSFSSLWQEVPFDAEALNIGQDGTGCYGDKLPAQLDEMIITSDILTEADIAALKEHYK